MPRITEKKLVEAFGSKSSFSREELFEFYRDFEPDLNPRTFGWRIHNLKNRNLIRTVKRGHYVISSKPKYEPRLSDRVLKIQRIMADLFGEVKYCIWETAWLNEFQNHLTSKSMLFVEVEKGIEETVYYSLIDKGTNHLYLNPDETVMDLYVAESSHPVIVKSLITRAPIIKKTKLKKALAIPSLEKILVDLLADDRYFGYLQGAELISVFENATTKYEVNYTKLLSYAKRREKGQEMRNLLVNHMPRHIADFVND